MIKKFLFALITCLVATHAIFSQESKDTKVISVVPIGRDVLSGVNIPKFRLRNDPGREYFQKRLFRGDNLSVFILSSGTADNKIASFPIEEYVYYLGGRADINLSTGEHLQFLGGDHIFVPKGFSGVWRNSGGNQHHLELSVVTTKRAPKDQLSKVKKPVLLDRNKLSGFGLTKVSKNRYRDVLYSGPELEISVEAEAAVKRDLIETNEDQFFSVLGGTVKIAAIGSSAKTFYAGDFFVMPKGFKGTWESKGTPPRVLRIIETEKRI